MTRVLNLILTFATVVMTAGYASADTLYEADFSTFADDVLTGQDGWDAQPGWMVAGGVVSNSGSWQRARHIGSPFTMNPTNVVRMTISFSMDGMPATGNQVAQLGFAKDNENTGNVTPQVFAPVIWDGESLSIGGATDSAYDSGDVITAELTFTRNASLNSWSATARCTNDTDGTSFEAGFAPADAAGNITPETCWEWMDMGGSANFSFRTFDNATLATMNVTGILLENNLPPDTPLPEIIYEADFGEFETNFLAGQDGWEAQADWVVTGGVANNSSSWQRARQLTPFNLGVGEQVHIVADMTYTGTPGPEDFFSLGFAKNNEDTGNNTPQVEATVNWAGSNLTIGGATDTGYDSGDLVTVDLLFTREATAGMWTLDTILTNQTDGTMFKGTTMPTDDPGTITPETAWDWLDMGNPAFFGMRGLNNSGGVVYAMANLLVEKPPIVDDPMVLLGDINMDGMVDLLDVAPFVALITDSIFQAEGDINGDSVVSLLDVAPFIDILTNG